MKFQNLREVRESSGTTNNMMLTFSKTSQARVPEHTLVRTPCFSILVRSTRRVMPQLGLYFALAQDLDLHSTSEEEDEEPDHMQDDHECESNSESEDRNQDGQPTVLKTMQGFYRRPEEPVSSILPAPTKAAQTPTNDSATGATCGALQM